MSRVRIVGGVWRSRLLPVAKVPGLRPTPDAMRERLFNWLGQDLPDWQVLDLFAGTGVLGFEAASRGAQLVVLVDTHPQVLQNLHRSQADLFAHQVNVVRMNAQDYLRHAHAQGMLFDLIFLDPPYHQAWVDKLLPTASRLLKPQGYLYIEAEKTLVCPPGFDQRQFKQTGQVHAHLFQRIAKEATA